jgi:membrane-associated phospholipid phosphatase
MKETLAKITTNIINPFLTSFIVLVVLAFRDTTATGEALKWAAISVVLSVLPVLGVVLCLVWRKKLDSIFVNPRQQRTVVYLLASALGAVGFLVLRYAGGPKLLEATFAAGLAAIVVFMLINLFWKISLHTAFMSGTVAVVIMVYGAAVVWTLVLLPPVAWARMALKQHSAVQVAAGAVLASAMVIIVFWGYGVVG